MSDYSYIIIGGGMTAAAAIEGIRKNDANGKIAVFSREPDPPYNRPPLTKKLWKGKPLDSIFRRPPAQASEFHLKTTIAHLDPHNHTVSDEGGKQYSYNKLLLATGGAPRKLPFGGEHIIYYRTLEDYRRVRQLADQGNRFLIIGGGFIGSELASSIRSNGNDVTMIFPDAGLAAKVLPEELSSYLVSYYRSKGVEMVTGETAKSVESRDGRLYLRTQSGLELWADTIIAGIGIQPNTELAKEAGLAVDNGILVNEHLQTSQANIYAAGDVASFYNPIVDKRIRVEHADNADAMGSAAGRSMSGDDTPYDYLPFFYSDLFDHGYEAVGELTSKYQTVIDWKEPFQKGVVYYLDDQLVRGVLLWNVWEKVDAARQLMAEKKKVNEDQLKGRL